MLVVMHTLLDETTPSLDFAAFSPRIEERQPPRDVHRSTNETANGTTTYRGRVFFCGYKMDLAKHIFPEYEFIGDSEWKESLSENTNNDDSHENDILVVGLWGPGCNRGQGDERTKFRGKILYINGEPDGDPVRKNWDKSQNSIQALEEHEHLAQKIYQIGPYPEPIGKDQLSSSDGSGFLDYYQKHSLRIYHIAMAATRIYLSTKDDVLNPWKQLLEGSSNEKSNSMLDRPRIPAIIYVSKNCVTFRQEAAELLARQFRDRAPVWSTENEEWTVFKEDDNGGKRQTQRRLKHNQKNGTVEDNYKGRYEYRYGNNSLTSRGEGFSESKLLRRLDASDFSETKKLLRNEKRKNNRLSLLEGTPRDNQMFEKNSNIDDSDSNEDVSSSFVHYGGECRVKGAIPLPPDAMEGFQDIDRSQFHSNYKTVFTRYKYCLVMENTKKDGYVTEKLLHALLGGCLPIYYGSEDVYQIFREDSFIYFDVNNPEKALAQIEILEANHTEYLRMTDRRLPLLKSSSHSDPFSTEKTVNEYFSILPNIGTGMLCRKIHEMMGLHIPESVKNQMEKVEPPGV